MRIQENSDVEQLCFQRWLRFPNHEDNAEFHGAVHSARLFLLSFASRSLSISATCSRELQVLLLGLF